MNLAIYLSGYWLGLFILTKFLMGSGLMFNGDYPRWQVWNKPNEEETRVTVAYILYVHLPWAIFWTCIFWRFIR